MPDQDQTPHPANNVPAPDDLDLDGFGDEPEAAGADDLGDDLDDLLGGDDELRDPAEPTAPEDADESLEGDDDLVPSESIENVTAISSWTTRGRNSERRKTELSMFQDFMTASIPKLREYSSGLQTEAERLKEIQDRKDREDRRKARLAARSQSETFLQQTEGASGYEAPDSDLTNLTALTALKSSFASIAGLNLDDFKVTPSTIEEKTATFPPERHSRSWLHQNTISQWLRSARAIAGLLPEWHEIEKQDIKHGRPVFKRIGISLIPDDLELPQEAEGFIRREIGPGAVPVGWHCKMQTSGAVYFIGEESSIVILNNSALGHGTSDLIPTGMALNARDNRLAVAIRGGLKALRLQAKAEAPMAGRDDIAAMVQAKINYLVDTPEHNKRIFTAAVGASAWDENVNRNVRTQDVSTATFNATNLEEAINTPRVDDIRQIARQTISNQNGESIPASGNVITNAIAAMTSVHSANTRTTSRNNLLKGESCVRSAMIPNESGSILTLSADVGKETLTTTFSVSSRGIPTLNDVVFSSPDAEPVKLTSALDEHGSPLNTVESLIATGATLREKMDCLRDYFEEGVGNRTQISRDAEILRSILVTHSGEISGVPYSPDDLAATAASIREEINAEWQAQRQAATVAVFQEPPPPANNAPAPGM